MVQGSILDNGAVYYPLLFGIPIATGIVVAWKRLVRRRALQIIGAACLAVVLVDFALDEERWGDIPFFVVVGLVLFGLGTLARWVTGRLRPVSGPPGGRVSE